MTSQTPPPSQDPRPEKKGNTDEENNHPDGTKENKTEKGDQKDDEEKTCIKKWGAQVTILLTITTIIVSIVMPLKLKKNDRKYWGGEACKTNNSAAGSCQTSPPREPHEAGHTSTWVSAFEPRR